MSKYLKVEQLYNKNQFVVEDNAHNVVYFQSYNSLVAKYERTTKTLTLGYDWDYSNTTRKHLYIFIREYCYLPEIDAMIDNERTKCGAIYKAIKNGLIKYDSEMI